MNKLALASAGFALLALAACGRGDQDRLDETQINQTEQENLDALANDAANTASEADTAENEPVRVPAQEDTTGAATGPETPYDEDIAGM